MAGTVHAHGDQIKVARSPAHPLSRSASTHSAMRSADPQWRGYVGAAWIAERKGYGERVGLTFGLLLSAIGFLIVLLLLPGRPNSKWKLDGPIPKRDKRARPRV